MATSRRCIALLLFPGALLIAKGTQPSDFPPITDYGPANEYGRGVQRSMRLMNESPASRKRTVRILFYGQSITQELWTVWLSDYLRQRFPNANLVITNRAIGYNAELLSRTAEADVYPWYPDLMIYQNYGSTADVEKIVANTRRRTTADIVLQTDHPIVPEDLTEPTDPQIPGGLTGDAWRNYVALPEIARKYGAELADVRTWWKKYLLEHNLQPTQVLRDQRHPGYWGDYLMADFVYSHLRVDTTFSDKEWRDAEKTFEIGRELVWQGDTLTLPFTGNRVDLLFDGNSDAEIEVRVDGRRPSEFPEVYSFTRTSWYPKTYWPDIVQIRSLKPLTNESWTATILSSETNSSGPFVRFSVKGSITGFDGEGVSTNEFISNSGRVVITPYDWLMLYWATAYFPILQPLPAGHVIQWESRGTFLDRVKAVDPDPTLESTATVIQGIANGRHILTLRRNGPGPDHVSGVRVFNPLARIQPAVTDRPAIWKVHLQETKLLVEVAAQTEYILESSPDWNERWTAVTARTSATTVEVPVSSARQFFRLRKAD